VLTNAKGFTVYSFAPDTKAASKCNGACAQAWPPALGGFCPLKLSGDCAGAPMAPNNPRQPMPIINNTSLRFTLHLNPEFILPLRRAPLLRSVLGLQTPLGRHL